MKIRELFEDNEFENKFDVTVTPIDVTPDGYFKRSYKNVHGYFNMWGKNIKSLKGAPEWVGGGFKANDAELTSLEFAPKYVSGDVMLYRNPITNLKGIGKDYFLEIHGYLDIDGCKITSHMLGILNVKYLTELRFDTDLKVQRIFNKHLQGNRDILGCKEELINAGYKELAKL